MKKVISMLLMSAVGMVGTFAWAGSARQDSVARLDSSVDVLHAIMATPDKGIPEEVLSNAKCILVVPNMIKGGFIFGGKHGRGVATCRTAEGWSAPAFVSIGGGSAGFQIGLEGVDLEPDLPVAYRYLFDLSLDQVAKVGPGHRQRRSDDRLAAAAPRLIEPHDHRVRIAGLTLEGAVVEQDNDSTHAIYGKHMMFRNILSGKATTPHSADAFLKAVSQAGQQAKIAEVKNDKK